MNWWRIPVPIFKNTADRPRHPECGSINAKEYKMPVVETQVRIRLTIGCRPRLSMCRVASCSSLRQHPLTVQVRGQTMGSRFQMTYCVVIKVKIHTPSRSFTDFLYKLYWQVSGGKGRRDERHR